MKTINGKKHLIDIKLIMKQNAKIGQEAPNFIFYYKLEISLLCYCVFALETNQNLSAVISKEVELGEGTKFDMFLRGSVTFDMLNKIRSRENLTGIFQFNPATVMIFGGSKN